MTLIFEEFPKTKLYSAEDAAKLFIPNNILCVCICIKKNVFGCISMLSCHWVLNIGDIASSEFCIVMCQVGLWSSFRGLRLAKSQANPQLVLGLEPRLLWGKCCI